MKLKGILPNLEHVGYERWNLEHAIIKGGDRLLLNLYNSLMRILVLC